MYIWLITFIRTILRAYINACTYSTYTHKTQPTFTCKNSICICMYYIVLHGI